MRQPNDPAGLLQNGRELLADSSAKAPQLGMALISIHSALERHFRLSLAQNERVPPEVRARVMRSREIDWPQLIDLMVERGGLSLANAETIRRYNMIRNGIAHRGETFRGTRKALQQYADLVGSLLAGHDHLAAAATPSPPSRALAAAPSTKAPQQNVSKQPPAAANRRASAPRQPGSSQLSTANKPPAASRQPPAASRQPPARRLSAGAPRSSISATARARNRSGHARRGDRSNTLRWAVLALILFFALAAWALGGSGDTTATATPTPPLSVPLTTPTQQ